MDREALSRAISRAVGSESAELIDWRRDPIHAPFNQATAGVYRITGTARDRGEVVPWSVILKVTQASDDPFGGSSDPLHPNYWHREALIYGSRLLEDIPGIRAPRCFGVDRPSDSTAWIWLEDVSDGFERCWSPAVYHLAAHRLGVFNGTYLAAREVPVAGYLSRNWLRSFVGTFDAAFAELPAVRRHPLVRRCWPDGLLARVLRLWSERDALLGALDGLPQTFCHLDAFPRNLVVDERAQEVVALDWSYSGVGAIGSELAPMVAASICFYEAEPDQMWSIDDAVFDGYLDGLRAAGWDGDPAVVRFGYTAAASLHYGLFPLGVFLTNEGLRSRFEGLFDHSAGEIADRWAQLAGFLLDQADEARDLLRMQTIGALYR